MDTFLKYRNDPILAKYQGWSIPYTPQQALEFFLEMKSKTILSSDGWLQLVIEDVETGTQVGDCAFHAQGSDVEIGITLIRSFHGKGIAQEALKLLFELIFHDLNFHRIIAICDSENRAVVKLLKKAGMRQEAHFVKNYFDEAEGEWRDEFQFAILVDEFAV